VIFSFSFIFLCFLSALPWFVSEMQRSLSPYWTKADSSSLGPVALLLMQEQKVRFNEPGKCFSNNPPSYLSMLMHAQCMMVRNPFESVMMMVSEMYHYITTNFKVSWIMGP